MLHAVSDLSLVEDRTTEGRARHQRAHRLVYVFLISLAGCVSDVVAGAAGPRWLSGGALAAFVACFVIFIETHPHTTAEGSLCGPRGSRLLRGGALARWPPSPSRPRWSTGTRGWSSSCSSS